MLYSVSNQPLGKKGKIINFDSRSSGSEWPYGFQFLFLIPMCIFIVHILENLCFEVHMKLQTIQQHLPNISLLLKVYLAKIIFKFFIVFQNFYLL